MSTVHLRVLGCGDAFSSGGRMQTGFLLEGGGDPLLLDCGATTLLALKRAEIPPGSLRWLVLTHLHGDHFGGLPWLILDGRFSGRTQPLTIAGPASTEQRLHDALEALYPGSSESDNPFALEFVAHGEGQSYRLGPATITPFEVIHPSGAPAYALRVEYGGKTIAYSGDTEWTDNLIAVARGSDLFLCECNDFHKEAPGHLDIGTLRQKLGELDCRRLLITHMGREMIEHADELEVETAADGMVIEL